MTTRGPATCPSCKEALNLAMAELRESTYQAAACPSAVRVARYNDAHADLAAALHTAWNCARCLDLAAPGSEELPLFPDLG